MDGDQFPTPPQANNMRRVESAEFYATIGSLNADSSFVNEYKYDMNLGYTKVWRTRDQRIIGVTDGGTTFCPYRYWLVKG